MHQETIREPERTVPVSAHCDVAVIGAGIAGAAAAVAAARRGASVCLIERAFGVGGLATLGNVIVFLPLCDGLGRQVTAGLAEEMLRLSIADESRPMPSMRVDAEIPECWRNPCSRESRRQQRYRVCFNPTRFMLALERWVLEHDIRLMYDTRFCAAATDSAGAIDAVIVENKDGRSAIACRLVVDASGDADVCHAVGEPVVSLDTNVRCGWYYTLEKGSVKLNCFSKPYDRNGGRHPEAGSHYAGDVAADVTAQVVDTRRLIWDALEAAGDSGDSPVSPLLIPTMPCFRMSRRLQGGAEVSADCQGQWFDDTVAMVGDWRKAGPAYCIPYGALVATRTPNLLTAGRCMSAEGSAWDAVRAIPVCAATGEAAGTAAALAATDNLKDLKTLRLDRLQTTLHDQGVILDAELLRD